MDEELYIAINPKTPPSRLAQLASSIRVDVRRAVAKNPNTPLEVLLPLAETFPQEIAENEALPLAFLASPLLFREMPIKAAISLAGCGQTPGWLLSLLMEHPEEFVASVLARNGFFREELLHRVDVPEKFSSSYRRLTAKVRHLLSTLYSQSYQPQDALLGVELPLSGWLRLFLARGAHTPKDLLQKLSQDIDPRVRRAVQEREEGPSVKEPLISLQHASATERGDSSWGHYHTEEPGVLQAERRALFLVARGINDGAIYASEAAKKALLGAMRAVADLDFTPWRFFHQAFLLAEFTIKEELVRHEIFMFSATAVAAMIEGHTATIAHVGSCRAYLWRNHQLQALTSDLTYWDQIRRFVEEGLSLKEFAQVMEDLHEPDLKKQTQGLLLRYIGPVCSPCVPDLCKISLQKGDLLLLCGDGLTAALGEEEISNYLAAPSLSLESRAKQLTHAAHQKWDKGELAVLLVQAG